MQDKPAIHLTPKLVSSSTNLFFSNSKSFLSLSNKRNDSLAAISYLSSLVQNSIQQCLWDLIFFAELSVILPNKVAHEYSFQKAGKAYLNNVQCIVIECMAPFLSNPVWVSFQTHTNAVYAYSTLQQTTADVGSTFKSTHNLQNVVSLPWTVLPSFAKRTTPAVSQGNKVRTANTVRATHFERPFEMAIVRTPPSHKWIGDGSEIILWGLKRIRLCTKNNLSCSLMEINLRTQLCSRSSSLISDNNRDCYTAPFFPWHAVSSIGVFVTDYFLHSWRPLRMLL